MSKKYRVFYNPYCQKFGIQKYKRDYMGSRWVQIVLLTDNYKEKIYTSYEGTAFNWLDKLLKGIYTEFTYLRGK